MKYSDNISYCSHAGEVLQYCVQSVYAGYVLLCLCVLKCLCDSMVDVYK